MKKEPINLNEQQLHESGEIRRGVGYGVAAFFMWGFFPLFFKQLAHVSPLEVLAHRIIWSMLSLVLFVSASKRWNRILAALFDKKVLPTLCVSTLLIATNWFLFIMAVDQGKVLETSFGYFMNPLVSVLLGFLCLGERLRRIQLFSLFMAALGVVILTVDHGILPWIALVLAVTFGLYGLLRKVVAVDALTGLCVETMLLFPLALCYLYIQVISAGRGFGYSSRTWFFLVLSGIITAIPLLWFAAAARRLRLMTIGFMQYITPTMHFLLAVLAFNEPLNHTRLAAFVSIWCGLFLYSVDAVRHVGR